MADDGKKTQNLQTAAEMAELFGVTERRVQQLAKGGIIPAVSKKPYQFDLLPTVQTYIHYLSEKANGRESKPVDRVKAEGDKLRAEADLKQHKAKIAELQLKELQGKMHRSEDVEAMTNNLVYAIRGALMALPGRLAMDVAKTDSAAEASVMIRAECYKILNELAGYSYDPEAYQRRVKDRIGWDSLPDDEPDDE